MWSQYKLNNGSLSISVPVIKPIARSESDEAISIPNCLLQYWNILYFSNIKPSTYSLAEKICQTNLTTYSDSWNGCQQLIFLQVENQLAAVISKMGTGG